MKNYCGNCGSRLEMDVKFCSRCGRRALASPENAEDAGGITWQKEITLLNNRFVLREVAAGIGIALLFVFILMALIFGANDGWHGVWLAFQFCFWAAVFFFLVALFTLLVVLGNRYPLEFCVNEEGIGMWSLSTRAHGAHRLAIILGIAAGNPGAVGAGLIARSQEQRFIPWEELSSIREYPGQHLILVKGGLLSKIPLYCTDENYASVMKIILSRKDGKP